MVPSHVIERALPELSPGVRLTILQLMKEFRTRRLTCSDVESFFQSVAWQSETLQTYYASRSMHNEPTETLSDEEMELLMSSQNPSQPVHACETNEPWGPASPPQEGDVHDAFCMDSIEDEVSDMHPMSVAATRGITHVRSFGNLSLLHLSNRDKADEHESSDFLSKLVLTNTSARKVGSMSCPSLTDLDVASSR